MSNHFETIQRANIQINKDLSNLVDIAERVSFVNEQAANDIHECIDRIGDNVTDILEALDKEAYTQLQQNISNIGNVLQSIMDKGSQS